MSDSKGRNLEMMWTGEERDLRVKIYIKEFCENGQHQKEQSENNGHTTRGQGEGNGQSIQTNT